MSTKENTTQSLAVSTVTDYNKQLAELNYTDRGYVNEVITELFNNGLLKNFNKVESAIAAVQLLVERKFPNILTGLGFFQDYNGKTTLSAFGVTCLLQYNGWEIDIPRLCEPIYLTDNPRQIYLEGTIQTYDKKQKIKQNDDEETEITYKLPIDVSGTFYDGAKNERGEFIAKPNRVSTIITWRPEDPSNKKITNLLFSDIKAEDWAKQTYKKYPKDLVWARLISQHCRRYHTNVLSGVGGPLYSTSEWASAVGGNVVEDMDGNIIDLDETATS